MWLKQFPRNSISTSRNKFAAPLKPLHGQPNNGPFHQDDLHAAAAITFLNINPNTNSKFRMKLESHSLKLSTIANSGISYYKERKSESLSEQGLNPDTDDDNDDSDKGGAEYNGKHCGYVPPNRFEFLLRHFVNLGYFICLVPFRLVPVSIGHKVYYEIRHHTLQRIISLLQCITASVVCFLVAYAQIGGQNVENNPLVIFNFWSYAVFCGWCFLFTHLFWRKEHLILAIVNKDTGNLGENGAETAFPQKLDEIIAAIYFCGVVLEEIYHKTVFYLFPNVYGMQRAAEVYSGKAMYSLFVANSSKPIPWKDISPVTLSVSIWHFIGWQSFGAIKSLFYIFVTFCSLFLIGRIRKELKAVKRVASLADEHDNGRNSSSKQIWSRFVDVRSTVQQINELTDLCVLGIYLILVPFLSSSLIQRWDSDFIEYKILMVLQFVWPMIALVCASEATRLGEKFLRAVKDGSDEDVIRSRIHSGLGMTHCPAYFVYENANLSMKGGKFFNVSYGFMGATLSVVVTYGLVILSFLHDAHVKKKKC